MSINLYGTYEKGLVIIDINMACDISIGTINDGNNKNSFLGIMWGNGKIRRKYIFAYLLCRDRSTAARHCSLQVNGVIKSVNIYIHLPDSAKRASDDFKSHIFITPSSYPTKALFPEENTCNDYDMKQTIQHRRLGQNALKSYVTHHGYITDYQNPLKIPPNGYRFTIGDLNLFSLISIVIVRRTSTTPSCSGPIPAQKSRGNSVLRVVFSHTISKMDVHYSHRFS